MLADYHVHTEFSDDSVYPLDTVCRDAIDRGFDEICITDHVDYGIKPDVDEFRRDPSLAPVVEGIPTTNVDYERYIPAIMQACERYAGRLEVRCGLEFGVQSHTQDRYNALFDRLSSSLDFIILSIHQVGNKEFWTGEFQRGRTQDEYNTAYYQEMLHVVDTFDNWSVLGHLDLIKRYDPAGIWPHEKSEELVRQILVRTIEKGKGIEINTSSFRYGLPDLQPCTQILKLYRELGGRVITFGSDSHKPEHLGAHIPEVRERLRNLGFTEFCTYRHMQPVFHAL